MKKNYLFLSQVTLIILGAISLAGCVKKGVDAKLTTSDNESIYRESLNRAWVDMSTSQQDAFNWAVSNLSLEQFGQKYKNPSPREVINREADEYAKAKAIDLAKVTSEYAQNAALLAEQELKTKTALDQLSKVLTTSASLKRDSFFRRYNIEFITQNNSSHGLSSADWNAWLFIDDEQNSTRHCKVSAYYKIHGGLDNGKTMPYSSRIDCSSWETIEVIRAKSKTIQMQLIPSSATDFGDHKIVPTFDISRATYENKIKSIKDQMEVAAKAKAALANSPDPS